MQNGTIYSSSIDFTDSDTFFETDGAAVNAHWGTERTYDYYLDVHGRNSYDDNGAALKSYVHYDLNFFNAFWDGYVMTYGDGDGYTATALVSLDIVGHEITHAVTERTAGLIYSYESGAVNESFSDIFGQSIEFHNNDSTASWNLGDEIYLDGVSMVRSMNDPNSQGDPDTYLGINWESGSSDNGGVHTNSGVQNYWYYLLVDGGTGTNDNSYNYNVSGIGLESAEQIAYRNLSVYLTPGSQYIDARAGSEQAAIDLFGAGSDEYYSVVEAWNAVGVPSATPQLNVVQTSLDFGSYVVGYTDSLIVEIQNIGTGILNIDTVYTTSDQFTVNNTNIAITTNSSYKLAVSFCPDSIVAFTDTLFVKYGIDTQAVALHGLGQDEPEIDVNPTYFSFTLNEGDSTTCFFSVTNTGNGDLYFQIIPSSIVEAVSLFNQRSKANYQKKSAKSIDGNLSILESSFYAQTYMNPNKSAYGRGDVLVIGSESDTMYFADIKNYLIDSGEFSSVTIFNAISATPTVEEMQVFDAVLVYSWYSFYNQDSLGDNLADFVDNNGNLLVAFGANIIGGYQIGGRFDTGNYWLIEPGNYSGGSEINLGTVYNASHPIMNGISDISAYSSLTSSSVNADAEVLADLDNGYPLIAVKDTGSKRVDLTIMVKTLASTDWGIDTGTDADEMIINAVKWMVVGSDWISVDVQEDTLSTSQSVTVNAKIKAGNLLGGDYTSYLTVLSNDLDESEVQIDFDLTVVGVPNISVQDSVDFNTIFTGVTASRALTINNTGSDQINVSSVDFSITEFSIDTTAFSVPPKSSVERTLTFNSSSVGTFTTTMTVNSNDPDEPAISVILRAEAVDPPIIGINPSFFDITLNSGDSTVQTLT
ncbi:MAG: M4 family metallopeptidase, partial [Candidatus Delongbacteria bacterium]|nr:M4 family metallopeptidase [Candidatus Delongbacteria bacterium]